MLTIVGIEFHFRVSCLLATVFQSFKDKKNLIHVEHVSINSQIVSLNVCEQLIMLPSKPKSAALL